MKSGYFAAVFSYVSTFLYFVSWAVPKNDHINDVSYSPNARYRKMTRKDLFTCLFNDGMP